MNYDWGLQLRVRAIYTSNNNILYDTLFVFTILI